MKHSKKLASLILVLVMMMSLSTTVFAAQEGELNGGSITINDAVPKQTYNVYQILYLESYNANSNAYVYKANSAWETWLKTQTSYVKFDEQGYVTWVEGADVVAFAKLAQAKATEMTADATASAPDANEGATYSTVKFEDLKLGYYLIDTTLGALCSLDTTNPDVVMLEKNEEPTIDKQVKEDSTGEYGDSNTAQIGDTIEFKTTIYAKPGAQNYVLHDKMSQGLTLNASSIKVQVGGADLDATSYSVKTNELNDGCIFEIRFKNEYLATFTTSTDIVVTYTAILNDKAVISTEANINETILDYGDNNFTEKDKTDTFSFMFDIIKTDSNKKLLNGAEFELYDAQTDGNKISLVKEDDNTYRVATTAESDVEGFSSAVIKAGKATVKGLDANTTYWLEEKIAPAGYNKLPGRVEVKIENSNLNTQMTGDTWAEGDGGVQITNQSGTELPSTGGMGTTIFYVLGSVLVLVSVVLLITKMRMKKKG